MDFAPHFTRAGVLANVVLVVTLNFAGSAMGVTRTWTGNAGNGLWSFPANWNPSGPPQDGDRVVFPNFSGSSRFTTNNLVALRLDSIAVPMSSPLVSSYRVYGNPLSVSNGISAGDRTVLHIECPVTLAQSQQFRCDYASQPPTAQNAFFVNGGLNLNGFDLELNASREGVIIAGPITGPGNLIKTGGGEVALEEFAFIGSITHMAGTLEISGHNTDSPPIIVTQSGATLVARTPGSFDGPITLPNGGSVTLRAESIADTVFVMSGSISGSGSVILTEGIFEFSGSADNSYSGTTTVKCRLLRLNKSGGARALSGPLIIGESFGPPRTNEVRWLANHQVPITNVSVLPSAIMNLNGFAQEISALSMNGGEVETGSGELTVHGRVSHDTSLAASTIRGNLRLPSGFHEFYALDAVLLDAELIIDATVLGPGHLRKTGPGEMWLNVANTYSGLTLVEEGTLVINHANALGTSSTGTTVAEGATLAFNFLNSIVQEPIFIHGSGVEGSGALNVAGAATLRNPFPSIFACMDLTTNATIRVESGSLLTVDGFISGSGPLTKTGPGTLVFSNANANTYSGDTIITDGFFDLRKPNGAISVPGNLVIGPAAPSSPAVARFFQTGGINTSAIVTANANSLLDLNGNSHTLARLNLNDGGSAQTGAARLNFPGGGVVQVGSLSPSGSHVSSSISGGIGLPPNSGITFTVAPYAIFPPFATGPELDVPAIISVNGPENVNFEPAGFLKNGLGRMRLAGNNVYKGEAFITGGTLQVDGSQPESSARIGAGARLHGFGTIGHVNYSGSSGVIAPGASPGILTTSNFNAGATGNGILHVELNGTTPGSGYDQVNVRGSVTLTGTTLNGSLNFASSVGQQFTIINNDGSDAVIGNFNGLSQGASLFLGGEQFNVSYTGGTGNDVVLTRIFTPPPPPVLSIEAIPPSSVRLLWSTNDPDFQLQFSTNLPAANWTAALPAPAVIGSNYVVTNVTSGVEHLSAVTPIAWYRLGEADPGAASGLTATNATTDSAGTNHLEQSGGPIYTSAVAPDAATRAGSSLAVNFNGTDQFFGGAAVVSTATNNFGIEAWVKPNSTAGSSTGIAYNGTGGDGWGLIQNAGQFSAVYGGKNVFVLGPVTVGTWTHLALVRDNGTTRLYFNGAAVGTNNAAPNPPTAGFEIGHRFLPIFNEYFNGAVDEVRVFTFAPGQFSANDLLINQTSPPGDAPPVRFYRLHKP